jgi:hypothetical protein
MCGQPVGNCDYIANSAQLKLELGLSLAKMQYYREHQMELKETNFVVNV